MSRDPYKYFRQEAKEILEGITRGILEIEKGSSGEEGLRAVLRLAHTLKGAAGVVKLPAVARRAHAIEDALAVHRGGSVPRETVEQVFRLLDELEQAIAGLDLPRNAEPEAIPKSSAGSSFETVRAGIEEINALLEGISGVEIQTDALRHIATEFAGLQHRALNLLEKRGEDRRSSAAGATPVIHRKNGGPSNQDLKEMIKGVHLRLATGIHRLEREIREVRKLADSMRLVPASSIFAEMERAARDAALAAGKEVVFKTGGGEHRVDAHVLSGLRVALIHLVRNAVVHGIEDRATRVALGKAPVGGVILQVHRRGYCISFECGDDGAGVDLVGIRQSAVAQGLIPPERMGGLGQDEALKLIFQAGVTTTKSADLVSGRGVGLDVVRDVAQRLKGQVKARSEPGRGMAVEIIVPVSLASVETLVVEQARRRASIPLAAIRRVVRLSRGDITTFGEGESILLDEQAVPFSDLATLIESDIRLHSRPRYSTAVILQAGPGLVALGVDRLLGTQNEVIRPIPPLAGDLPLLAGASFDSEGNPNPVIDPQRLQKDLRQRVKPCSLREPEPRSPILVVDDSLTTRMLEQMILEANGFEVDFATSGEEALKKLRQRRYGLLLVDVEMPGMSGFEFLERARSDPDLKDTPMILVTTRGSPEDRRRGLAIGANAYMVKSDFDEDHFLRTIREFMG